MNYSPIIIIGAGRSGTNMLRDMLTAFPGVGTWPCDEINYIWRHGNARYATDEFPPELARPRVRAYIRRAFDRLAARRGLSHVVEKTCANSLRVQFVRAVVPEARFIHIVRDGRDVAVSAVQRWTA
ncbi:MAG TPA: sulfotransferase, partial [Phycisphaerae bacterium]|nr:sulfotransferase [Phycisphaerae bacterium]